MKRFLNGIGIILVIVAMIAPAQAHAQAKNVIVLISDGWGQNHILATNYYQLGTAVGQTYESFPVSVVMSNYMNPGDYDSEDFWSDFNYGKYNYTDSAAAGTAMSGGKKTYGGAIGVDVNQNKLVHFMQYCEDAGKATGVVTSVEFSHATPASYVAHNVDRNRYSDIAREMILDSTCEVIMGAGNPMYGHNGEAASSNSKYIGGMEIYNGLLANATAYDLDGDGLADNMVEDIDGDGIADPWTFIQDKADFQALMTGSTPKRVVGVPKIYQTLQQSRAGANAADLPYDDALVASVPSLAEMTAAAINVLDNDADGFALMVEGGAVDWAGHANTLGRIIEEQIDFNNAVDVVVDWVNTNSNWNETLVIVTGDHETGYLWGPDAGGTNFPMVENNGAGMLASHKFHSGNHSNQLIPFYAKGAGADYFKTTGAGKVGIDQVRGPYTDNTKMFYGQMEAIGLEPAVAAIMIDSFEGITGKTISVPVCVDMNLGDEALGSYSLEICWDPSLLSFNSAGAGDSGWDAPALNAANASSGSILISSINPIGSTGKVMVSELSFTVTGDAGDIGKIYVDVNGLGAAQSLTDITDCVYVWDCEFAVKPSPPIWGDADGSHMVNSFDGLIIASYAIGLGVGEHTSRVETIGDVDANGGVSLADAYACVLYDVDPANSSLPARIGQEYGMVPRIAVEPLALPDAIATPRITSDFVDNSLVVQPSISADTELGAASVVVSWDPAEYSFVGIEGASGMFVANENNVLSGELTMALISTSGANELTFPQVILKSIASNAGTVSIRGLEAIQSGSLMPLDIATPDSDTAVNGSVPVTFALGQNTPNPFNPTTTISYSIPTAGDVSIAIYSIQGQKIRTLVSGHQDAGSHSVVWDATDDAGAAVSSGMYLYRLTTPGSNISKSMTLLR